MRPDNHPFPEHSFLGACVRLAQSTFFDSLPANQEGRTPVAPTTLPAGKIEAAASPSSPRWVKWLDSWFHEQGMKEREAYLAQSRDVFDLERRMQRLQRRPYY